jgi:hypothetical protein
MQSKRKRTLHGQLMIVLGTVLTLGATAALAAGPTGAIFTTTPDGSVVNANVQYQSKLEVYLDGGPGPNAPQTAAGLDDGLYVFQVTDPAGKYLLSMDPSKCRVVAVQGGVIVRVVPPSELGGGLTNTYVAKGKTYPCQIEDGPDGAAGSSGRHDTNTDLDHGPPAIVVQLMPFGTTPNPGGVYKAWVEKFATYLAKGGDLGLVPTDLNGAAKKECPDFCADRDAGFGPATTDTKTDNFKVKVPGKPPVPPIITVKKFHDRNANGVFDGTDEWVTGWQVDVTDPTSVTNPVWTPAMIVAEPSGDWLLDEENPAGTVQTASYVDGVPTYPFPADPVKVVVSGASGETHEVVFGNVGLGKFTACKKYFGSLAPIVGWRIDLSGTLANGAAFGPVTLTTGSDGCATIDGLLPGAYTAAEIMAVGWQAFGDASFAFTIESTLSGATLSGGSKAFDFVNFCKGTADFDTKGYWHNPNGIAEITQPDIDYVDGLAPYRPGAPNPDSYWQFMPFDGSWAPTGNTYFGTGAWGEISDFLVNNVNAEPLPFQLSQQLLAFIFNVRHRLDGPGAAVWTGAGWMTAQEVIDAAIAAWLSPQLDDDAYWEPILDGFNNDDAVEFIHAAPCPVVY